MTSRLISVIMPVWNEDSHLLDLSISSILNQSYKNLELIIIHQKSSHDVDEKIKQIFQKNLHDDRLKIFTKEKPDFVGALNLGISKANGDFIARMDADDISEKIRFDEQLSFLQANNCDLVGSWGTSISTNGDILGKIELPITHNQIRKKILFHNPILHPSIFLRREVFDKVHGYNPSMIGAEDYDLYIRIISENFKVGNVPKLLINLRETKNSMSRGRNWKKYRWKYFKAKENAVKNLGFNSFCDVLYFLLTPLIFLFPPSITLRIKNISGYYKTKK